VTRISSGDIERPCSRLVRARVTRQHCVSKYGNYEVMPMKYGDSDGPHLFAVCFFPYQKDVASSDEVYERLYSVWREEWDTRYERLGRHVDVVPHQRPCAQWIFESSPVFLISLRVVVEFLTQELESVITANKELWELLAPLPAPWKVRLSSLHCLYLILLEYFYAPPQAPLRRRYLHGFVVPG
jgi:hypothetical protein